MEQPVFQPNMVLLGINVPVCTIILITRPDFSLGYSADNDAVLQFSREISRHHAKISYADNGYTIVDLKSTNHTFVNDAALIPDQPVMLQNGDHIRLASFVFEVKVITF